MADPCSKDIGVSIVIPTYKRPDLLSVLLGCIQRQTHKKYEVIVVNDGTGSPEYTELIKTYEHLFEELIYVENETSFGAPFSRNRGIKIARYDWLALVDDDDEWLPDKLEKQLSQIVGSSSDIGLIYTWAEARAANAAESYLSCIPLSKNVKRQILETNFIVSSSVVVKKRAVIEVGMFDEAFPSCQDWDMWTRIFLKGYDCALVPEVLTIYNRHGNPSIGLGPNALRGYEMFVRKYWRDIIRQTSPVNILKKAYLYMSVQTRLRFR